MVKSTVDFYMSKHSTLEKWGMFLMLFPMFVLVVALAMIMSESSLAGGWIPNGQIFLTLLFWGFPICLPIILLGVYLVFRGKFLKRREGVLK